MKLLSLTLFLFSATAAAAESNDLPTISPTFTPTTTLHPTSTPTIAPIPAPVPFRPCYSNLTEIENLVSLKSPFTVETFILCPDTTYTMGSFDPITNVNVDGWKPIFTRANSIFQCGEDGKSSNNCVISGGNFQMMHEVITFNWESKDNVVVKGITFEDATSGGVLLAASGDITFIDCIFRNNQNRGALQLLYCESCLRFRRLKNIASTPSKDQNNLMTKYYADVLSNPKALASFEREASRYQNRLLQEGEAIAMQKVTVDGCLFESNVRGSGVGFSFNGVIYLATVSNQITIKNSIFRNNNYANQADGAPGNGYALASVEGSKVIISDTCFTNNLFSGKGVVVLEGSAADFTASRVFGTIDEELSCPFASVRDESCVDYDSATCTAVSAFNSDSTTKSENSTETARVANMEENTSGSTSVSIGFSFILMFTFFCGFK